MLSASVTMTDLFGVSARFAAQVGVVIDSTAPVVANGTRSIVNGVDLLQPLAVSTSSSSVSCAIANFTDPHSPITTLRVSLARYSSGVWSTEPGVQSFVVLTPSQLMAGGNIVPLSGLSLACGGLYRWEVRPVLPSKL